MSNSEFYTKGDKDSITSRIGQVHTITMFCPMQDMCVQGLKVALETMLPYYRTDDDEWKGIPAIDALNVFIFNASVQEDFKDTNKDIFSIIISSLKMFNRLKYINFKFTDDDGIFNIYNQLLKGKKLGVKDCIYNVESIEMNLSEMFSQRIVDLLNMIFVHNEIIPNSYLERKFLIEFSYEEYAAFMDMFLGNNSSELNSLDTNIIEYLKTFPSLVIEQKPSIRLITNYRDEVKD